MRDISTIIFPLRIEPSAHKSSRPPCTMADASDSDSGCIGVLSSCFKKPCKEQAKAPISSNRKVATAPSIPTTAQSSNKTQTSDKLSAPLAAGSQAPSSAAVADSPISHPAADQKSTLSGGPVNLDGLWQEAYQEADTKTRIWIDEILSDDTSADPLQEMVDLVRSAEDKYKEKSLKLRVGDREILWRDYTNRVVSVVTAIGDVIVHFGTARYSAVWSPVKVLLKVRNLRAVNKCRTDGCLGEHGTMRGPRGHHGVHRYDPLPRQAWQGI